LRVVAARQRPPAGTAVAQAPPTRSRVDATEL
jgi:hypothetical protein